MIILPISSRMIPQAWLSIRPILSIRFIAVTIRPPHPLTVTGADLARVHRNRSAQLLSPRRNAFSLSVPFLLSTLCIWRGGNKSEPECGGAHFPFGRSKYKFIYRLLCRLDNLQP